MIGKISTCEDQILAENRLKFAAWTASRAAMRGYPGFTVEVGLSIIKNSKELESLSSGWDSLPPAIEFDKWHEDRRAEVVDSAKKLLRKVGSTSEKKFTHGIAAKIINVYLKALNSRGNAIRAMIPFVVNCPGLRMPC